MKKLIILLTLLLIITTGCINDTPSSPTPPPETIKVGVIYPGTGQDSKYGSFMKEGYRLALKEINDQGGINGKKIELIIKDDFSSESNATKAAEDLVKEKDIVCILGSYSSSSNYAISKICRDNNMPLICVAGFTPEITTEGNEWVFRICASVQCSTNPVLDFILPSQPLNTIAVLHTESALAMRISEQLKDYAEEKGMKIVIDESYKEGMINFKPLLKKIKEKNPDILYMTASVEDAPLMMKQIKEIDLNPKVFVGSDEGFIQSSLIEEAGDAAEYVVVIAQWHKNADYPGTIKFVKKYKEKFKREPTSPAVFAYTGLMVVTEALKRAETENREDIRKALKETNMYSIVGPIRFEDYDKFTNQNDYKAVIMQVQNGKLIPLYPPETNNGKLILPVPKWSER